MWSKEILKRTYFDRCSIYRKEEAESPSGLTRQVRGLVAADVPCALSRKRPDGAGREGPHGVIAAEHVLFMDPGVEVLAGDEVEVIRQAAPAAQRYWAGEPFVYSSHQEIPLRREERA